MPPWTSAGRLERAALCPASGHLPRQEDEPGDAAIWGKVVHSWKETGVWPTDSPYRISTLERRETALVVGGTSRETLWPSEIGVHEFKVAVSPTNWDWDTVNRVGSDEEARLAWKNQYPEEYAVGISDWFARLDEQRVEELEMQGITAYVGQPWIDDLKTGREIPDDPLILIPQRLYATAGALYTQEPVLCSLTHWPRSPADGIPRRVWSPNPWGVVQAERFQKKLKRVHLRVLESKEAKIPNTVPGEHCRYCPSMVFCPEYTETEE